MPPPTRGLVLISLDTLRADHLGAYGYPLETSPFIDSLARRGSVFEWALVQYPATLTSHMSIFTGYYPQQHAVYPPASILAPEIGTLPEAFAAHGFRTAGHTEGGFVAGGYGFDRGFEEFTDTPYQDDTDVERTFGRGLEFLRGLGRDERFFLFLHTYSIHDPYTPPERYRGLFWEGEPSPGFASTGANLRRVNEGELAANEELVRYFRSQYDASIRYVDDVLRDLFAEIEALGLAAETTIVLTSDHGEEFLEHGKVGHVQIYPEDLRVPLLIIHPDWTTPQRIATPVESIDLMPTLLDLAGLKAPSGLAGRSLVPLLTGAVADDRSEFRGEAYAEVLDRVRERTLVAAGEGGLAQLVESVPAADPQGIWITRTVTFDVTGPALEFGAVSFYRPRTLAVEVDGRRQENLDLGTERRVVRLALPRRGDRHRVTLTADDCDSPADLGVSGDSRCLSFELRGLDLERTELYDLARDPEARRDLSVDAPELRLELTERLERYSWTPLAPHRERSLDPATEESLRVLGYLD